MVPIAILINAVFPFVCFKILRFYHLPTTAASVNTVASPARTSFFPTAASGNNASKHGDASGSPETPAKNALSEIAITPCPRFPPHGSTYETANDLAPLSTFFGTEVTVTKCASINCQSASPPLPRSAKRRKLITGGNPFPIDVAIRESARLNNSS